MLPEVANLDEGNFDPEILPSKFDVLFGTSEIKYGHIVLSRFRAVGDPRADVLSIQHLMPASTMLIDLENFLIRDQRGRGSIVTWQISAEKQRRTEYAPQRHHGPLLVLRKLCRRASAFLLSYPQDSERKHIRIRPGFVLADPLRPV